MPVMTHFTWCKPVRGGAGGVFMPIVRRSAEEYPGSPRAAWTRRYFGGLHHAASHHWCHHLRPWHPLCGRVRGQGGCNLSTPEAAHHHGGSTFVQTVLRPLKEDRDGHDQRWPLILAGRHRERTTA